MAVFTGEGVVFFRLIDALLLPRAHHPLLFGDLFLRRGGRMLLPPRSPDPSVRDPGGGARAIRRTLQRGGGCSGGESGLGARVCGIEWGCLLGMEWWVRWWLGVWG